MKMTPERFDTLLAAMRRLATNRKTAPGDYAGAGLSPKRFRWDALWHLRKNEPGFSGFLSECYADGLNDTHLDTALRRAVKAAWGDLQ